MGITEDINWLKGDEEGVGKVFSLIADKGSLRLRKLKELYGSEDWWPVKSHVRALVDRGLIVGLGDNYRLTENGRRVLEGLKAMEHVEPV